MKFLPHERYERILKQLETVRTIKVYEIANELNVSEKTIREDLKLLEDQGLLIRIHGGATLPEQEHALLPVEQRRKRHLDKKAIIAQKAVSYIEMNDTVILDSGSTLLELAKILPDMPMTVITNDILIIPEILKKNHIHLYVPGGYNEQGSTTLLGEDAIARLTQFRARKAFIGTTCYHPQHGCSLISHTEVSLKKAIIRQAETVYLLADQTKFHKVGLFPFARADEIDLVITDDAE